MKATVNRVPFQGEENVRMQLKWQKIENMTNSLKLKNSLYSQLKLNEFFQQAKNELVYS